MDVIIPVAEMAAGPLGERSSNTLENSEPRGGIGSCPHVIQGSTQLAGQELVVALRLTCQVVLRSYSLTVGVGRWPVHAIGRNGHELERRVLGRGAGGHQEHDLLLQAGELPNADQ